MDVQELMLMNFMEQTSDVRELKRAIAVRMRLKNYSREQVTDLLPVGPDYVTKWSRIFNQEGVAGLKMGYQGSSGYLGKDERIAVIDWLNQQKQWSLDSLIQHLKTVYKVVYQSKQSYYHILKQAKLSWKKVQPDNPKKDPEQVADKRAELSSYFTKNRWLCKTDGVNGILGKMRLSLHTDTVLKTNDQLIENESPVRNGHRPLFNNTVVGQI